MNTLVTTAGPEAAPATPRKPRKRLLQVLLLGLVAKGLLLVAGLGGLEALRNARSPDVPVVVAKTPPGSTQPLPPAAD